MKSTVMIACVCLLAIPGGYAQKKSAPKKSFELKGEVAGLKGPKVVLVYDVGGKDLMDSTVVVNGKFRFTGSLDGPTYSRIWSTDGNFMAQQFLENTTMTLTRKDPDSLTVLSGSATELENIAFKKTYTPILDKVRSLSDSLDELGKTDSAGAAKRQAAEITPLLVKMVEVRKEYVRAHPKSLVSLVELATLSGTLGTSDMDNLLRGLDPSLQQSNIGKQMAAMIAMRQRTEVGVAARDFTQKNEKGGNVSLSSFRGNYVLVDFWASWCGPCRAENPNVVKTYNRYKDKGFAILGVSLDDKADKWKEAIVKDQLTWTHVSDLKGWGNAVAVSYGVTSVPANYLIDPKGIIVARNLRGEDLEKKLAEVYGSTDKAGTDTGFVLEGNMPWLKVPIMMLRYAGDGKSILDTAEMVNGRFIFRGRVPNPSSALLISGDYNLKVEKYLENTPMTITQLDSGGKMIFTGSATQAEDEAFKATTEAAFKALCEAGNKAYDTPGKDSAWRARVEQEELNPATAHYFDLYLNYVREHPRSYVSLGILLKYINSFSFENIKNLYNGLDKSIQEAPTGQVIGQYIVFKTTSLIGKEAKDFTQKDDKGRNVSLASYRGKYVLVDFWASWCGPCRMENPNVVKAYNKYKDKGFDILSVSIDDSEDKWKEAIREDKLAWTQVSDLKGAKNAAAVMYNVVAVPSNFLIDPKGKVVAQNLRGADLEEMLDALLSK